MHNQLHMLVYLCKTPPRLTKHLHTTALSLFLRSRCWAVFCLWCPIAGALWSSACAYPKHNGALLTLLCINISDCCSPSHLCNPQGSISGACLRRRWIRESLPYQPSLRGQIQLGSLHWGENDTQCPLQSFPAHGRRETGTCLAMLFTEIKDARAGVAVTVL